MKTDIEQKSINPLTVSPTKENGDTISTSMTICIAALADKGKKAILVADKLVTTTGLLPYQVDMAADKIISLHPSVSLMFCGGITDATNIIERSKKVIAEKGAKYVSDIAQIVNDEHLKYLIEILTRLNLTTRGIKDMPEFYREYSLKFDEYTRASIDTALTTHNLSSSTQFIVCGKDSDDLFKVYYLNLNPRLIPSLNTSGYSVIGSGWSYANVSLINSGYMPSLTESKVKEIVEKAKKEAEKDRDVGDAQDISILK